MRLGLLDKHPVLDPAPVAYLGGDPQGRYPQHWALPVGEQGQDVLDNVMSSHYLREAVVPILTRLDQGLAAKGDLAGYCWVSHGRRNVRRPGTGTRSGRQYGTPLALLRWVSSAMVTLSIRLPPATS